MRTYRVTLVNDDGHFDIEADAIRVGTVGELAFVRFERGWFFGVKNIFAVKALAPGEWREVTLLGRKLA